MMLVELVLGSLAVGGATVCGVTALALRYVRKEYEAVDAEIKAEKEEKESEERARRRAKSDAEKKATYESWLAALPVIPVSGGCLTQCPFCKAVNFEKAPGSHQKTLYRAYHEYVEDNGRWGIPTIFNPGPTTMDVLTSEPSRFLQACINCGAEWKVEPLLSKGPS